MNKFFSDIRRTGASHKAAEEGAKMEEQVCMVFSRADRQKRCRMILDAMNGRSMTAREVAYALGFTERNATAPRLTEMVRDGRVSVVGKVRDTVTGKTVSVYKEVPAWTTL